jgi:zinc protease
MNRKLYLIIFFCIIIPTSVSGQINLKVERTVLENGLTILTCEDHSFPTVSYQTFVNAGSRDELRAGATGVAHVLEHLMFRGTPEYPDYREAVSYMGPQVNAYTGQDYTCYYVNARAEFLPDIMAIEADRLRNLKFSRETFLREMGPVREERRRFVADDPDGYMEEQIYRLAYRRHTYEHPVIGWENDVEQNMSYRDVVDFKEVFYAPNFVTIAVVGDFETDKTLNTIHSLYGDWPSSLPPIGRVREEPQQTRERTSELTWKSSEISPKVNIAYHGPDLNFHDNDLLSLQILARMLFDRAGKLHRLLKDELKMVEEIDAYMEGMKDPGLFLIDLSLRDADNRDTVLQVVYDHFERVKQGEIEPGALDRVVNQLKSGLIFRLDKPSRIAGTLGYYQLAGGDYQLLYTYYDRLDEITEKDLVRAAQAYLTKNNRSVVTLLPADSEGE